MTNKIKYTFSDIKRTYKPIDAFWTVFVIDPLVTPFIYLIANFTKITPAFVTFTGFLISIASSLCFLQGTKPYLIAGAILFEVAFCFDCIDGKLARLTGQSSPVGAFYELLLDQFRMMFVVAGTAYGQFRIKGDAGIIVMALTYISFHFFWLALKHIYGKAKSMKPGEHSENHQGKERRDTEDSRPEGLRRLLGNYARKNRLIARYTSVEIDTFVFVFAVIFLEPETGFFCGLILWTALTIFKVLDYSINIYKKSSEMS